MAHDAYQKLKDRFRLIANLGGANSILYVDSATTMKPGSDGDRSEQMMAIASASHMLMVDPAVGDWLDEAEQYTTTMSPVVLSPADQRNLQLMRHQWTAASALPETLVRELARLENVGNNMHTMHRDSGNWAVMKPVYEQAFNISRERGLILKDALGFDSTYEALLDHFSPGLKLHTVETEFAKLERALPPMIAEAVANQKSQPKPKNPGTINAEKQARIGEALLTAMGFDSTRGILFNGEMHPFSGGTPDDSRLTTHYYPKDILDGLYTVMHETGHSLYEQNTPADWRYQPAGHSMGMDIHESQSMVFEQQAGKTREFFNYLSALAQTHLPQSKHAAFTPDNLARLVYNVNPSFIRIQADELTYPGHIILRFNIERDLIEGKMTVDDLPDAWNAAMKKTFGITPKNPAQGHMQDVHWPTLSAGYFPAYTLGAMGAAQFFAAAKRDVPILPADLAQGKLTTLTTWLNKNVHGHGSLLSQDALFTQATGKPLSADDYLNHLANRYLNRPFQP